MVADGAVIGRREFALRGFVEAGALLPRRVLSSPLPPRSGGEGSGVGGLSAGSLAAEYAELPPTPDPSAATRLARVGGGGGGITLRDRRIPLRHILAACRASRPARGARRLRRRRGGPRNYPAAAASLGAGEPRPASPRLIAGLSSSASAGPIGCTSGRDALEFGALDFGVLPGFLGGSGFFAMAGIWDEFG